MSNTIITHRWYENIPLNKSQDIKISVLQAFVII